MLPYVTQDITYLLGWRAKQFVFCRRSGRLRLKCDGTRAETRFRYSAKRTSPFKSAGASVQSAAGSRGVRISGSNSGFTMFRGSVKSTGYPLHSLVSLSLPLACVTVCDYISTGLYCLDWPLHPDQHNSQTSYHIVQMCPSCFSRLSVVFVTYHNICCQITQHCNVNSHCCESIKSCAVGSFACHIGVQCHVPPCIACDMSEPARCCVEFLPATARSLFQRHCIVMHCHSDLFWGWVLFCLFDVLPWFSSIASYPWGVRIFVLKREQKGGSRNCVSCHFLFTRLKHTKWNSICFMWL